MSSTWESTYRTIRCFLSGLLYAFLHRDSDLDRTDHKLVRARFKNMPMRKDKLVRDYFGEQIFITTSGHFSTPALICVMTEIGAGAICFSIDYPFESIPNGCVWFHEHVPLSPPDMANISRNNSLQVFDRLTQGPHNLKAKTSAECFLGGLDFRTRLHCLTYASPTL